MYWRASGAGGGGPMLLVVILGTMFFGAHYGYSADPNDRRVGGWVKVFPELGFMIDPATATKPKDGEAK